jgi:hypothetical protein
MKSSAVAGNVKVLNLRAGELVEVRSDEEILRTLDSNGMYEALPFTPEIRGQATSSSRPEPWASLRLGNAEVLRPAWTGPLSGRKDHRREDRKDVAHQR